MARLVPAKGLKYLLDAAAILLRDFPLTKFVIAGSGPELESLERQASGLNIRESVEFAGIRTDTPGTYASFDVFALPSLFEGMPMALMEAMASGRPVVASAVGSVPQMIVHDSGRC
jgi:glycosyltransferase involved in cell wall biosynthesis